MSRKSAYGNQIDDAIIQALQRAREPLRYNELHRKANGILGHRIWIKTFNDHLKKLHEKSVVVRKEKNRYCVTYELETKHIDIYARERASKILEDIEALTHLPGGLEFFSSIVENAKVRLAEQLRLQKIE